MRGYPLGFGTNAESGQNTKAASPSAAAPPTAQSAWLIFIANHFNAHNAAAVILAHNHPSGVAEPSRADELITLRLRDALSLVDIRVLDHLIVAGPDTVSLAERGLF